MARNLFTGRESQPMVGHALPPLGEVVDCVCYMGLCKGSIDAVFRAYMQLFVAHLQPKTSATL